MDAMSITSTHQLLFSNDGFLHGMMILGAFSLIETSNFARFLLTIFVGSSRVGGEVL
jgi:hypothetical protein